jgi:hypothetical protein
MTLQRLFSSRKFTTAVCGALLVGLNDSLGLGLEDATIRNIVALLTGWLVGESVIDAAFMFRKNGGDNGGAGLPASPRSAPAAPAPAPPERQGS